MVATKNLMKQLLKLDGVVDREYNPFDYVIQTPSPSFNSMFGNTWGLPFGYTMALWGPPKGGKTLLFNAMVAQLHADDPEAIAIKFNTEFREELQSTKADLEKWKIDTDRLITYEVNSPSDVFDRIAQDINEVCQEGLPVKLIGIDSLQGIVGRRTENATTINTQQIGDDAMTLQVGLKMILPTIRNNRIALVLNLQTRAEMDPVEILKKKTKKMAASWAVRHFAEYFVYIEKWDTIKGRSDGLGNEMVNDNIKDIQGKKERTGHRIRATMTDTSVGAPGRNAEMTFAYNSGIINIHEEVVRMALGRGILEKVNNLTYSFEGTTWKGGKPGLYAAFENDQELQDRVLKACKKLDIDAMGKVTRPKLDLELE